MLRRYLQQLIPGGETGHPPGYSPTPGFGGALQRLIPGGQTGYSMPAPTPAPTPAPAPYTAHPATPQQAFVQAFAPPPTAGVPTPGIPGEVQRILPGGEPGVYDPLAQTPTPGIPGAFQRLIPGGATGYQPTPAAATHGPLVKTWHTGTAFFGMHQDGYISVLKKDGRIKTYRPYRPVVLSKNHAENVKKMIREMKHMKKIHKDLGKLFPTRRAKK